MMIGLTTNGQKITSHLANFVQIKEQSNADLSDVKNKLIATDTRLEKCEAMCNEMSALKSSVDKCVNNDDLNELVDDIRNSFELFLNTTPRPKENELENQMKILNDRLKIMEDKLTSIFGSGEVEIITAEVPKKSCSSKIPKLEIKKK